MGSNWPGVKYKLQRIHPVMRRKISTFENALNQAAKAAKKHDPECVFLLIDACKLSVALYSDVEHLIAVGIMSRDGLQKGIEEYMTNRFHDIFLRFSTDLTKEAKAQIMTTLVENASGLEHRWLQRLVSFAREVKEMEFGRQSSQ